MFLCKCISLIINLLRINLTVWLAELAFAALQLPAGTRVPLHVAAPRTLRLKGLVWASVFKAPLPTIPLSFTFSCCCLNLYQYNIRQIYWFSFLMSASEIQPHMSEPKSWLWRRQIYKNSVIAQLIYYDMIIKSAFVLYLTHTKPSFTKMIYL